MYVFWSLFACAPEALLSEPVVEGTLTPSRSVLMRTELLKGRADAVDLRLPPSPGTFSDTVVVREFEEQESGLWTLELDLETLAEHTALNLDPGEVMGVPVSVHAVRRLVAQGGGWIIEVDVACDLEEERMLDGQCEAP